MHGLDKDSRLGISLVPTYPSKWYTRSNTATALLSLSIAIYYGVYEFALTSSVDNSGITFQLAVIAAAHALYGLTLFFVMSAHHPKLAGFIGFIMFFLVSAYAFWISKDTGNTYFAILVIAGLLSGLYGWLLATIINASIITLLIMIQVGEISANENYSALQVVIYVAVSVMTILLWSSVNRGEDEPVLQKMQKAKRPKLRKTRVPSGGATSRLSTDTLIN